MADSLGLRRDDGSQVWEVVTSLAHGAQAEVTAQTELSAQDSYVGFVRHRTRLRSTNSALFHLVTLSLSSCKGELEEICATGKKYFKVFCRKRLTGFFRVKSQAPQVPIKLAFRFALRHLESMQSPLHLIFLKMSSFVRP